MKCSVCGAENRSKAHFCENCGAKIETIGKNTVCGACGRTVASKYQFCPFCGTEVWKDRENSPMVYQPSGWSTGAKVVLILGILIVFFIGLITVSIFRSVTQQNKVDAERERAKTAQENRTNVFTNSTESPTEDRAASDELTIEHYDEGIYRIGNDMLRGTYLLFCSDDEYDGYCSFSNASSMELLDDSKYSDSFFVFDVVYVETGDLIKLDHCIAVPFDPADWSGDNDVFKNDEGAYFDGGYLVGETIPAGTYEVTAVSRTLGGHNISYISIWESPGKRRLDMRKGIKSADGITRKNLQDNETITITLEEGQYVLCDLVTLKQIEDDTAETENQAAE